MGNNLNYMRRRMQLGAQPHKAKASGAVATFRTNLAARLDSLFVDVTPVQDLHGQANPYPAGGGKNKANPDNIESGKYIYPATPYAIITSTDPADMGVYRLLSVDFLPAGQYTVSSNLTNCYWIRMRYTNSNGDPVCITWGKLDARTFELPTDATEIAISFRKKDSSQITESFWVQLEAGAIATAYAPYSNVCPITGWAAAKVAGTGKNLVSNAATDWETGGINSSGQNATANDQKRTIGYFPVKGGSTMKLSGIPAQSPTSNVRLFYYAADGTFIDYYNYRETFPVPEKAASFRMRTPKDLDLSALQLEYDTATAYTPYVGTTAVIQFGSTLYGARIDWKGRKAVCTHAYMDLGDMGTSWNTDGMPMVSNGWIKNVVDKPANNNVIANMLCTRYRTVSRNQLGNNAIENGCCLNYGGMFLVKDSAFEEMTKAQIKDYLTGVMLAYPLATPIEIPLDLVDFVTVPGVNNVFADCGNVDLSYWTNV